MTGKADLHIHSTASDGKAEPADLIQLACQQGLSTVALTDHDTIAGYEEARRTGEELGIRVLSGVEITTDFEGRECHMLAYCFDVDDVSFNKLLKSHKKARVDRARWIIGELSKQGLELDIDEVRAEAGFGNVGRPHIASILIKKGYVGTAREAFMRYLSDQQLGPIHNEYRDCRSVIQEIKKAGGAAILAHPGLLYSEHDLHKFIEAGIDGIEYVHPSHNFELQDQYRHLAEKEMLLMTGGSDYHGPADDTTRLGVITISEKRVERMIRMTAQRRKIMTS